MTCCDNEPLGPILVSLLECLSDAFEECGVPPCRSFISTDQTIPWDVCCECEDNSVGQLWVGVTNISPLNTPTAGAGPVKCPSNFTATVNVGLLRCALTQSDNGDPPTADLVSLQSLAILRDRQIMMQAIKCCWAPTIELDDWTIGDWDSLGPWGSCAGGLVELTIRFGDRKCAP